MDGLPDSSAESARILKRTNKLRQAYKYYGAKIGKGKSLFRTIAKIPVILAGNSGGLKLLSCYIDRLARKYSFDESEYAGEIVWSLGTSERMRKAAYLPVTEVEFCGRTFHAPACWDQYLSSIYGDYMTLPEEAARTTHEYTAYAIGEANEPE